MIGYWLVQLGYLVAIGAVILIAVRRDKRETGALVERLLADMDRRANLPLPAASDIEGSDFIADDEQPASLPIPPAQLPAKVN